MSYSALLSRKNSGLKIMFLLPVFFSNRGRISNRNCRLDNHDSIRINFHHKVNYCLNSRCIKKVLFTIIVGRGSNYNKLSSFVGFFAIKGAVRSCCFSAKYFLIYSSCIGDFRSFIKSTFSDTISTAITLLC